MKRRDVGTAVGKGAVSAVTKWIVGIALTALVGGGVAYGVSENDDDNADDRPNTEQVTDDDD